jgi:hypothetical protein
MTMPNRTYELRKLYFQQNQYAGYSQAYPSLLHWPSNAYFPVLKSDAELLREALMPIPSEALSLSDQIFGQEMKQQQFNLKHFSNLFYERCRLHHQHIGDIQHRHMQIQEDLYAAIINKFPDRQKRQSNLESQLLQLENSKRDEELAFWKDTADLREKLFETAGLYRNAKNRYSIFSDLETEYGRQG